MPKKKILVADDEDSVRAILTKILVKSGYEVVAVNDGMEASIEIGKTEYDLIITDYNMPRLNGIQLTRMAMAKYPSLPVIIISGAGPMDDFLRSGALVFIKKPFRIHDVLSMVQRALGRTMAQTP